MNLNAFFEAGLAVQIHLITALAAAILGTFVLWRRKGGRMHRLNGRIWVGLMFVTAFSSFFIHEIRTWGLFSPIHLLSIFTPIMLVYAIFEARRRRIQQHRTSMQALFVGGIVFAGAFTFMPGRLMNEIFLGWRAFEMPENGWVISLSAAVVIAGWFWFAADRPARR